MSISSLVSERLTQISPDAYTTEPEYIKFKNSGVYQRVTNALHNQLVAYRKRVAKPGKSNDSDEHRRFQDLVEDLGNLSRLIYQCEKELNESKNPPCKSSINVFVFEHTSDYHLVPAYKKSTENLPGEVLNFIFRPNLDDPDPVVKSPKDDDVSVDAEPKEPRKLLFERDEFLTSEKTWLVGYDIETQAFPDEAYFDIKKGHTVSEPSVTVSHQWYFNFQGVRFGVVLLTPKRLSQVQFVKYLNLTIPETTTYSDYLHMKCILVYAYFSVYESGWLKVTYRDETKEFTFRNRKKLPIQVIMERNDEWYGYSPLREIDLEKPGVNGKQGKASTYRVQLIFADAIKLQSGGLKKLGQTIGIEKQELPTGVITEMAEFIQTHPFKFCDYAITDSIIAAEAHLHTYHTTKRIVGVTEEKTRMPGYSVAYFSKLYMDRYPDPSPKADEKKRRKNESAPKPNRSDMHWKTYLGYENGKMSLIGKAFTRFYYGGRNDVVSVGPREKAYYLDLHSAYLTSVVMLKDYNFSKVTVRAGAEADARAQELFKLSRMAEGDGPFQVVGIECSFVFKRTHATSVFDGTSQTYVKVNRPVKPIFPIRIDESAELPNARVDFDTDGIIYPRCGSSCITWPEYWAAVNLDLLEHVYVYKITEFDKVADPKVGYTNWLAEDVLGLLIKRKQAADDKYNPSSAANVLFLKNFLNFFYGKTAQGIQETSSALKNHDLDKRISTSAMTCFPLASYITGFCRSVVGELLQLNDCYGITTDGFITPTHRDNLVTGDLCNRVQMRLSTGKNGGFGDKKFIGSDYTATKSLFLKTRGYMFIDETIATDETKEAAEDERIFSPKSMLQKIAKMGAQLSESEIDDPATAFLEYLQTGYSDKKYFVKLQKIRKEQTGTSDKSSKKRKMNKDATPEKRKAEDTALTMTFDMKHIPVNPKIEEFEWQGIKYPFVSFETVPLETATDFHMLRMLIKRDYTTDLEAYADPGVPDKILPITDIETEYTKMRAHWNSSGIKIEQALPYPYTVVKNTIIPTQIEISTKNSKTALLFKYSSDKDRLTEILLQLRAVPKYLRCEDYQSLLVEFEKFKADN